MLGAHANIATAERPLSSGWWISWRLHVADRSKAKWASRLAARWWLIWAQMIDRHVGRVTHRDATNETYAAGGVG